MAYDGTELAAMEPDPVDEPVFEVMWELHELLKKSRQSDPSYAKGPIARFLLVGEQVGRLSKTIRREDGGAAARREVLTLAVILLRWLLDD